MAEIINAKIFAKIKLSKPNHCGNHEEKRAEFCKKWLVDHGAEGVYIDPALNTVFPMGCEKDAPVSDSGKQARQIWQYFALRDIRRREKVSTVSSIPRLKAWVLRSFSIKVITALKSFFEITEG